MLNQIQTDNQTNPNQKYQIYQKITKNSPDTDKHLDILILVLHSFFSMVFLSDVYAPNVFQGQMIK